MAADLDEALAEFTRATTAAKSAGVHDSYTALAREMDRTRDRAVRAGASRAQLQEAQREGEARSDAKRAPKRKKGKRGAASPAKLLASAEKAYQRGNHKRALALREEYAAAIRGGHEPTDNEVDRYLHLKSEMATTPLDEEGRTVRRKKGPRIVGANFRILIDGEPAGTLREFLRLNDEGLDPEDRRALMALRPGETFEGGGGAAASYTVTHAHSQASLDAAAAGVLGSRWLAMKREGWRAVTATPGARASDSAALGPLPGGKVQQLHAAGVDLVQGL